MEKQYSTKKRRVTTNHWAKPNKEDISNCKATLMNSSGITVCDICFVEEDDMYTEVIDWLQCEKCSIWVHKQCVNAPCYLIVTHFFVNTVRNTLDIYNTIMYNYNKIYNSVNCMVNTIK